VESWFVLRVSCVERENGIAIFGAGFTSLPNGAGAV